MAILLPNMQEVCAVPMALAWDPMSNSRFLGFRTRHNNACGLTSQTGHVAFEMKAIRSTPTGFQIEVTNARLSDNSLFADIQLASLETRRMYAITLNGITSKNGETLYDKVGYYTLNQVALPVRAGVQPHAAVHRPIHQALHWDANSRRMTITTVSTYQLTLKTVSGRSVRQISGNSPQTYNWTSLESDVYFLTGSMDGESVSQSLLLP
jgi:hypothetical protein